MKLQCNLAENQNDWDRFLLAGYMKAQCFQKSRNVPKAIIESKKIIEIVEKEQLQPLKSFRRYLAQTRGLLLHRGCL